MKILIVTPHFYPENFKCNDMAFELSRRGHDVSVMTAIPDYPGGKFFGGCGVFRKRRETVNGVKIHRSLIIPRGRGGAFRLALNYLSYTFFASLKAIGFGLTCKYDVVLVHETSPVMVGIPATIIKKMQKIPMHFWVLDLWPESLSAAGGISNSFVLNVFKRITSLIYSNSDSILIGSKGYRQSINKMGDYNSRISYFPNWVDDLFWNKAVDQKIELPKGFNVMIAGNIGDAQDSLNILNSALALKDEPINFIFVGDGRKKSFVETFTKSHGLQQRVFCLGRYPLKSMPQLYQEADVLFMALKDEPIFSLTVPSRLQSYMSSGKPVVAMINGDGADLIREADCGWSVPAGDSKALADLLKLLSKESKEVLVRKGENGKAFSEKHFKFKDCIDKLENIIQPSANNNG